MARRNRRKRARAPYTDASDRGAPLPWWVYVLGYGAVGDLF